jgi:hypothetical protein
MIVLLGNKAQLDASLSSLDIVLILTQDRCTVCAERTTASEKLFWTYPMERTTASENSFGPFGDRVSVGSR